MELMSSLLLCALMLVPQASGRTSIQLTNSTSSSDFKTVKVVSINKSLAPNTNSTISQIKVSDLQSVFKDQKCKVCLNCMERAINAHKVHNRYDIIENFHNKFDNEKNKRDKRKAKLDVRTDNKTKKTKSKTNKTINIVKYKDSERVYALKIIETNAILHQNKSKSSCQVYSIRKSFPCESSEADIILKETKRKINKKSKKEKNKKEQSVSDTKTTVIAPVFRKRQIEESQALEQIMPSIEDVY